MGPSSITMAPMKGMKAAAKGAKKAIAEQIATACELKKTQCAKMLDSLVAIATAEVKETGVFSLPGVLRLKTRTKPATKAGKREIFGKVVMVKAKPAKKIVKAFPAKSIKDSL